jgi:eukaryotic-like serine/threonine-protein kinase
MSNIECVCPTCSTVHQSQTGEIGRTFICTRCRAECIVPSLRVDPGMRFGPYHVLRPVGCGASSEVHLAEDSRDGRQLALKILFVDEAEKDVDTQRFLREVKNASTLSHPNLLEIYDTGQAHNLYFLAMEFVEGDTIDKLLEEHGELPEKEALGIARDVATAMRYAWNEKQLVHRDIKPGNIIISFDGRCKLMDLGIAKSLLHDLTKLTAQDMVIGSPPYMSPEQCSPGKLIDFRADIYSLGATLFHLLTNEFPFLGKTSVETLRLQLFGQLPDPRSINPQLSDRSARLIQKMMAKSANNRHLSWDELLAEINSALK